MGKDNIINCFLYIEFKLFNNYIVNLDIIIIKSKYLTGIIIVSIKINDILINSKIKRLNMSKINHFPEKITV